MKSEEKLQKSYLKQKQFYDEGRSKRISHRQVTIEQLKSKISDLQNIVARLEAENQNEQEFESFESFRLKSQQQSEAAKNSQRQS